MGDGAVPKQAAAAGEVIVRGCPQQGRRPQASNRLCKSATACQCIWPSRPRQRMLPRLRKDRHKSRVDGIHGAEEPTRGRRTNTGKKKEEKKGPSNSWLLMHLHRPLPYRTTTSDCSGQRCMLVHSNIQTSLVRIGYVRSSCQHFCTAAV